MSKIGRPREYRDKEHRERAEYMREWYARNKKRVTEALREDRAANPEKYRARDRERYEKHKAKRAALAKKWHRDNPEKHNKANAEWAERNPEKRKATLLLNRALRRGQVIKLDCEVCGSKVAQAHHDDYSKPLAVRWLCPKHHGEHHKKLRAKEREIMK